MKKCSKCKEIKELGCFSKDKKRPDGLYLQCKPCVKEASRKRYLNNKDEINAKTKKWKQDNKEAYLAQQREYNKDYIKTPSYKYREYRNGAIDRNYEFDISFDEFMSYWQKPCAYCGVEIETVGLDRVDNSLGYSIGNIQTCCFRCNRSKDTFSKQEYIEHCKRVVEFNK